MKDTDPSLIVYTLAPGQPEAKPLCEKRLPRITRLMALAIRFDELLRAGKVKDYAALARLGCVSRARITQIMNLLNLAPDIQEALIFLEPVRPAWRDPLSERVCRDMLREPEWARQRQLFARLLENMHDSQLTS
jgi:hypothetical protein